MNNQKKEENPLQFGKTFMPKFAIGQKVFIRPFPNRDQVQETIVTGYVITPQIESYYPDGMEVKFDNNHNPIENRIEVYISECRILYQVHFGTQTFTEEGIFTTIAPESPLL